LALLLTACTQNEKETPSGLKFTVLKAGDGILPKTQQMLVFDYTLRDSKDSLWNDSYSQGLPAAVPIADSSAIAAERGLFQMFRMLSKGDSIEVSMSIGNFFMDVVGGPLPEELDSTLVMTYRIQVNDIMSMEDFRTFQQALVEQKQSEQNSKDVEIISKYLVENNIQAQKDSTGLAYVIHTANGGSKPTVANCVEVSYRGSLLENGYVFDASDKLAMPLGGVIAGWQLGIPKLGVGDSATFYIPSGLAYGPRGSQGAIPPNAILIFDVALLDIGNGYDNATGTCN
jgi:FKBP-type peptidyl-prolyl cis-trans isomerase